MNAFARPLVALTLLSVSLAIPSAAAAAFPGKNGDIAYQRFYKGGSEIFSANPRTGKAQRLTSNAIKSGESIAAASPSFGPDGKRITFTNAVKVSVGHARSNNLFVMRADGSHPKQLTDLSSDQFLPTFSADGKMIAVSDGDETYVQRSNGKGKATKLTARLPNGGVGATFSPDGTKVAIASSDGGDSDIFLLDVDGSSPVNLTADSDANEYSPDFSPDGSRIAFTTGRDDPEGDVWVMSADGSDEQPVAAKPGIEDSQPAFSPDGTKIAYTSRRNKRAGVGIFIVASTGGTPRNLPHTRGAEDPSWGVASR